MTSQAIEVDGAFDLLSFQRQHLTTGHCSAPHALGRRGAEWRVHRQDQGIRLACSHARFASSEHWFASSCSSSALHRRASAPAQLPGQRYHRPGSLFPSCQRFCYHLQLAQLRHIEREFGTLDPVASRVKGLPPQASAVANPSAVGEVQAGVRLPQGVGVVWGVELASWVYLPGVGTVEVAAVRAVVVGWQLVVAWKQVEAQGQSAGQAGVLHSVAWPKALALEERRGSAWPPPPSVGGEGAVLRLGVAAGPPPEVHQ